MTAQAAPEAEEARPPVTQVVEVIEEEIQVGEPEAAASVPEEAPKVEEPQVPEAEPTSESITRKEKVEELYQGVKESSVMPEISVHKGRPIKSLFVWAIVTILVAILTGGILVAAAKKTSPLKLFVRPTPTPTATPAPPNEIIKNGIKGCIISDEKSAKSDVKPSKIMFFIESYPHNDTRCRY